MTTSALTRPKGALKKGTKKKAAARKTSAGAAKKQTGAKDISASFNKLKSYNGQVYSGVQIGRGHHWNYDAGDWKETKITPDLWEISYAVTKRRVGHAPDYSGAPVGTEYHWYILAHQTAKKMNANDYDTKMTGLKFKLAHKRAENGKWSVSAPTQRKHLVEFLKSVIQQLEKEPTEIAFEYEGQAYKGEAVPVIGTCKDGFCSELEISLNNENLGIIRHSKSGWKMDLVEDQKFVNVIGEEIVKSH